MVCVCITVCSIVLDTHTGSDNFMYDKSKIVLFWDKIVIFVFALQVASITGRCVEAGRTRECVQQMVAPTPNLGKNLGVLRHTQYVGIWFWFLDGWMKTDSTVYPPFSWGVSILPVNCFKDILGKEKLRDPL